MQKLEEAHGGTKTIQDNIEQDAGRQALDMKRILIVEDDEKIAMLERDYLESSGYEICRQIRNEIDIPILMVTARTESVDVIRGLGLGADDYITKPFDPSQLVARVRSHLKRYARLTGRDEKEKQGEGQIRIGDVVIEPKTWKVWKKGEEKRLPNREFELLRFLAENPNLVFSKEELFEKIWGYDYVSDAATVSVHINRLREKIEDDARNPKIIETIWGAGYRLNADPDASGSGA